MAIPLSVLVIADNEDDTQLVLHQLRSGGYDPQWQRVDTPEGMRNALAGQRWDIIISDYCLPRLPAEAALRMAHEGQDDIPFIIVSGANGEDTAVAAMKAGAHDYVMKDRLSRLFVVVEREIREAGIRRDHRKTEDDLRRHARNLQFIYDVSRALNSLPPWEGIEPYLASAVRDYAGAKIVLVSKYLPDEQVLEARHVEADAKLFQLAASILNTGLIGFRTVVDEGARRRMLVGVEVLADANEATFGTIGKPVAAALSKALGVGNLVAIPLVYQGQLWGSVVALLSQGAALPDTETLGTVGELAAQAVQRRETDERFRATFERSSVGKALISCDGRLLRVNAALVTMLGYPLEEIEGQPFAAFTHADDRAASEVVAKALLIGDAWTRRFEMRCIGKDGDVLWVDACISVVRDGIDCPQYFIGELVNITERKRAEEELRRSQEVFRSLVETTSDFIWEIDAKGVYNYCSPQCKALWGFDAQQMVGKTLFDFQPAEDRDQADPALALVLAKESAFRHVEMRYVDAMGNIRLLEISGVPLTAANKTVSGYRGITRDMTERKRADEERGLMQASLAQSDRLASMGMLAAGVAHEINNPLSYILYNLESLSEDLPRYAKQLAGIRQEMWRDLGDEVIRAKLGKNVEVLDPDVWADAVDRCAEALGGTRKIKNIARGLAAFSRVEKTDLAPVYLRHPIESALNIAFNEIKYRARIEKDIASTGPVLASEGRLSQVFLNLFINAAHAIHDGDVENNRIRIRTWQEDSTVLAEVRDTGCGIPSESLAHLFDPFFTTKAVGVGSGLGLSIVRNIITGYGGSIEVASEVGKGTCFVIRLPAADLTEASEAAEPSEDVGVEKPGRILVIDDETNVRLTLRRILKPHEVIEADSGERAREIVALDQCFDVVLCDVMMPKISGMDLHRWLAANYPELAKKVVFVTGGAFTQDAREYLTTLGNPRVEKPFDGKSLAKLVVEWVRAARAGNA